MPFKAAFMFRPGYIQPVNGVRSRTPIYNALYTVSGPFFPLLRRAAPNFVTTTEKVGRAMIEVASTGAESGVLDVRDINRLAEL